MPGHDVRNVIAPLAGGEFTVLGAGDTLEVKQIGAAGRVSISTVGGKPAKTEAEATSPTAILADADTFPVLSAVGGDTVKLRVSSPGAIKVFLIASADTRVTLRMLESQA